MKQAIKTSNIKTKETATGAAPKNIGFPRGMDGVTHDYKTMLKEQNEAQNKRKKS